MAGIARVFLDGAFARDVDLFSPYEELWDVIFTAADLANGPHTLTIQVTGEKTPASTNTYVVVDAFDVPAPTITRFQEIDRAVSYSAGWTQDITGDWSQGSAAVTTTPGAQATFTFT